MATSQAAVTGLLKAVSTPPDRNDLGRLARMHSWCQDLAEAESLTGSPEIGQQQVVIKTLGERLKQVQGVSGAAILGDGKVGLILEPSGLLALHNQCGGGICLDQVAESGVSSNV